MQIETRKIECTALPNYKLSRRKTPFWVVTYTFNYQTSLFDKALLTQIVKSGADLARKVNPGAANNSRLNRTENRLRNNATAGVLAEFAWMNFLNTVALKNIVTGTDMENAATQIDLKVIENNKTIEVRSSFPRNGIEFAICHEKYQFDILGAYANSIKPGEIQKDFYLRTLYHVPKDADFFDLLHRDGFAVHLTGGATWEMMSDDNFSKSKTLKPEDSLTVTEAESDYRVVPFESALDSFEMLRKIQGN